MHAPRSSDDRETECVRIRVLQVREARFSLEDVFISIVEKARLEGKIGAEE